MRDSETNIHVSCIQLHEEVNSDVQIILVSVFTSKIHMLKLKVGERLVI